MTTLPPARLRALLALCQTAALIDHLALTGTVDAQALTRLLDDLLDEGPAPEARDYALGREVLEDWLRGELPAAQRRVPRYLRAMLRLERALARRPELLAALRAELERVARLRRYYARDTGSVCSALAGAYLATAARVRQPVLVTGALRQLARPDTADRIRCLLLGGLQAAARWRAAGGRRWDLRFRRAALLTALRALDAASEEDGLSPPRVPPAGSDR